MHQSGRSIIEILVIVAIVGILVAIVALPFSRFRSTQALENTTNTIVSVLDQARARTLAGVNDTNYGVHVESGAITLFEGNSYSSGASGNEVYVFESPVTLGSVTVNGGGSDIVFDRLKGTTSDHGTIVVTISGVGTRTITITATGSVKRI
jgi:type II secretory pathway pseudopilin PulG